MDEQTQIDAAFAVFYVVLWIGLLIIVEWSLAFSALIVLALRGG